MPRGEALETAAPPTSPRPDLERIWPYIPGLHRSEIEREFGVRDVLKLASNENPLGPSPRALAAIESVGTGIRTRPRISIPARPGGRRLVAAPTEILW